MNRDSMIYVAGHTGLVGSAIVRSLETKGYRHILTRSRDEVDLMSQEQTRRFFVDNPIEYVFLAAAKVGGIMANSTQQGDFIYENLVIAMNVIRAAQEFGAKKLLNLGSSCIYPRQAPQPIREEYLLSGPLEPTNEGYAIAKIAALKMCRYFNEQYGTNFLSVMPTNLYGPGDSHDLKNSHVLPGLIRKFHLGKLLAEGRREAIAADINRHEPGQCSTFSECLEWLRNHGITKDAITLWGSGQPRREFLHVDDLAEATVFLMKHYNANDIGEVINIGVGEDISICELAVMIREAVGYAGKITWDSTKPDGMPRKLLDVSRIRKLGWQPTVPLAEGIACSYQSYLIFGAFR
ncbi:MAG: GDP-L-fucose synthase [Planctomycetaceae bacterium]|nr:GDP-L-fucose synthase [Planctomycetaceae bacterium]